MSSTVTPDDRFQLTADQADQLAAQFGTPLYVVGEQHFRDRIRRYQAATKAAWANSAITFASKANSTLAVMAIAASEGCLIDVASEGELRAALAAGIPASQCHLHGNNKSQAELEFAIEAGVHEIVVDNFNEIELIASIYNSSPREGEVPRNEAEGVISGSAPNPLRLQSRLDSIGATSPSRGEELSTLPELILRLAPGVDPVTHAKISTGQADTKFGFNITDGSAEKALVRCLELGLPVVGFHCHVGSQLLDPEAQRSGGALITDFAVEMLQKHGFKSQVINVGGGLGIRYTDNDNPMPVEDYCRLIVEAVKHSFGDSGLNPTLLQEPGRSMIGESGITLYRVGVNKSVPAKEIGTRHYLVVDGGLSDNPRPVMYGSKYTIRATRPRTGEMQSFRISGKHCETDMLFDNVPLPADTKAGDLLQVLCTGAYNSAMASNYNRFRRPATILIRSNGTPELIQRPETWDEMFAREIVPTNL